MIILIKAAQLILSLSILVIVHELGHFAAARLFKTRVEKFYLFFDPWFSLLKFRRGETEYGIGWVPLGGYVKIAGMIDESLDREQMKLPPQPWEFRSKPAWQRLIIMLGGVIMNVVLAIGIYIGTLSLWGEQYLPNSEVRYGITTDSIGEQIGLRNGDKILSIDNKEVDDFFKIPSQLILDKAQTIQIERDSQKAEIALPQESISKLLKHQSPEFLGVRVPFEISDFATSSGARDAGLKKGDRIIAINGKQTPYFDQFRKEVKLYKDSAVQVGVVRASDTLNLTVNISKQGTIGVAAKSPLEYFKLKDHSYNFFQAIPAGTVKAFRGIGDYLKQLKLLFSPEVKAYESVGGFITIGNIFPSVWNWESFWSLTAFLSIMLAILNVLPIPALDGGHVMFLLYEIITGRKPSDKFMEYSQIIGMILLLGLLVLANGNDIIKLFR